MFVLYSYYVNEKTCFFIGSRHTTENVRESLKQAVETHITEYGVTHFTVGRYGNFDRMVQGVLMEAKQQYENIHLYLLAPYALTQKEIEAPKGFDGTIYPDGLEKVPFRLAIVQANRITIKNSDYLIAHPGVGNSGKIVEFAQRREKKDLIKVTLL